MDHQDPWILEHGDGNMGLIHLFIHSYQLPLAKEKRSVENLADLELKLFTTIILAHRGRNPIIEDRATIGCKARRYTHPFKGLYLLVVCTCREGGGRATHENEGKNSAEGERLYAVTTAKTSHLHFTPE